MNPIGIPAARPQVGLQAKIACLCGRHDWQDLHRSDRVWGRFMYQECKNCPRIRHKWLTEVEFGKSLRARLLLTYAAVAAFLIALFKLLLAR